MEFDGPQRATKPAEAPHACPDDSTALCRPTSGRLSPSARGRVARSGRRDGRWSAADATEIGRRFGGGLDLRHRIKRADRLLGNAHLQRDAKGIYAALARQLLAGVAEPLIVIDWSDLKEDQSLHLLRASLPVGGRSLMLYEEVHPQCKLGNRQVQYRFLQQIKALVPGNAEPIIVADSGFKVPFYREVERLGWRWVGRACSRARSSALDSGRPA